MAYRDSDDEGRGRKVRRLAPGEVELAALDYLRRFSVPAARLRRHLRDKAARSAAAHGDDLDALQTEIDSVVASLVGRRLVDDDSHAEARVAALRDRGVAPSLIRQRIIAEGVSAERVDAAVDRHLGDLRLTQASAALQTAVNAARRRRLGPFRAADERAERRDKDLVSLVRAGHRFAVARQVIDAVDGHALLLEVGLVR